MEGWPSKGGDMHGQPGAEETTAVIVVAAGRGARAGDGPPKQWRDLGGKPVLAHTLAAFRGFARLILVLHPDDMAEGVALTQGRAVLVAGGPTRRDSARNALETLDGSGLARVLIQDGARPFASPALIGRVLSALDRAPAAAPALPVSDALWRGQGGRVTGIAPRDGLWRAQTPQGFRLPEILTAHRAHGGDAADDVEVALAAGLDVAIVQGEEDNIKLTYPGDFDRAERILKVINGCTDGKRL